MATSRIQVLENTVIKLESEAQKIHDIVNGDVNTEVQTDNGPVSSLAKAISDLENTARRLRDEAEQFRNEASDIKDQTDALASNAGVSENNAQSSADAASNSATAAQDTLEEFQGIYHGRLSGGATPSSADLGDLYFNEDDDRMEVYTSAGWVPTASAQLNPQDFYEKVANVDIDNTGITLSNGSGFSVANSGIGSGFSAINNGSGEGILAVNSASGQGLLAVNSASGQGLQINNDDSGEGIVINNEGAGKGLQINNNGSGPCLSIGSKSTGSLITSDNFAVDSFGGIYTPNLYYGNGTGNIGSVALGNFNDFFTRTLQEITVINHNIILRWYLNNNFITQIDKNNVFSNVGLYLNGSFKSILFNQVSLQINDIFSFRKRDDSSIIYDHSFFYLEVIAVLS